jgi:hypothetical protein
MADLTVGPDDLRVAVSKEQVKDAPNIEREGDELFSANEPVLCPHCELNYSPPANRQRTAPDEAQHSWEREEQSEFAAALRRMQATSQAATARTFRTGNSRNLRLSSSPAADV